MASPEKMARLLSSKEEKLGGLTNKTFADDDLSRKSYTDMGDGYVENNGNKIWGISEDWTPQENAFMRDYVNNQFALPNSSRDDRRAYDYGVKEEGRYVDPNQDYQPDGYEPRKIGLSSGRFDNSDYRYQPGKAEEEGLTRYPYGWGSGSRGVDVSRKHADVNLQNDAATAYEALIHSNRNNIQNRLVRQRDDGYYDYESPEGIVVIDKAQKDELFGSGASEYYWNNEALFDNNYNPEEVDQEKVIAGIRKAMALAAGGEDPVISKSSTSPVTDSTRLADSELDEKYTTVTDRLLNTVKGFGATFTDSLIVAPAKAVGDLTGLYETDTAEENTKAVNKAFGYKDSYVAQASERVGRHFDVITSDDASVSDKVRAAGNSILEAVTTPELLGTSFGALASWMMPGSVIKAIGIGTKYAKTVKGIDSLVDSGQLSANAGRVQKAKEFMSIDGAVAAITAQSGFMVSAMGNVNNQYEEFVENNNGVELEGSDKVEWYTGRFAIQMFNQNLDKITDVSIIKSPATLAALRPAVKAMTDKEFTEVALVMGKGVVKTGFNASKESVQEYSQTMMELFNSRFGSAKFEDVNEFTAFVTDERNVREAGIAGLMGAGGSLQFEMAGSVLPSVQGALSSASTAAGKLGETIKDSKPATSSSALDTEVAEEDLTKDERESISFAAHAEADSAISKYSKMLGDEEAMGLFDVSPSEVDSVKTPTLLENLRSSDTGYHDAYEEVERAEATIESRIGTDKAKPTDLDGLKVLKKTKRELLTNLMGEEKAPSLGSGITPSDILQEFIESIDVKEDGKLDITASEKAVVDNFVKTNKIPEYRFKDFVSSKLTGKDPYTVHQEAILGGEISATAHKKKLHKLLHTPNPSRKAVQKVTKDIEGFLVSQETRGSAFSSILDQTKKDIDNYNKLVRKGTVLPARKSELLGKKEIPGYSTAYVMVSRGRGEELVINKSSQKIKDSIQDTIDYLRRIQSRYEAKVHKVLGSNPPSADTGLTIRPHAKFQDLRDQDKAFYDKVKVTKAIVNEDNPSPLWSKNGDYYTDNKALVNSGQYTEDDVVIFDSLSPKFSDNSSVIKELKRVREAGASIVIDGPSYKTVGRGIHKSLHRNGFRYVDTRESGGTILFMPAAKAVAAREAQDGVKDAKRLKNNVNRRLMAALRKEERLEADNALDALASGEITQEEYDLFRKAVTDAEAYFKGGEPKMREHFATVSKGEVTAIYDRLMDTAKVYNIDSVEVAEESGRISQEVYSNKLSLSAFKEATLMVEEKIQALSSGEKLVKTWKKVQDKAKLGEKDVDMNAWIEDNIEAPRGIMESAISNSIGNGRKPLYTRFDHKKKDFVGLSTDPYSVRDKTTRKVEQPYQVIEQDPGKYLDIGNVTFLNSLSPENLRIKGKKGVPFNTIMDSALKVFKDTISAPDMKFRDSNNSILPFANSALSSIMFDKDLNPNENIAIAMRLGLNTFIKNNGHQLKKGKKSRKEVAEMLGKQESQVSRDAMEMLDDKGLLYKTASNSIGKEIAGMLGFMAKSDSEADAQAYDALVADLGQTALLMGVTEGLLNVDNTLSASAFARTALGKTGTGGGSAVDGDLSSGPKVLFIEMVDGKDQEFEDIAKTTELIAKVIPDIDVGRKEPLFKRPSKSQKTAMTSKIRKEKLGLEIPSDSKAALSELTGTEWTVDLKRMAEVVMLKKSIMKKLGYIKTDDNNEEYAKLSYEEKEVQESINRGLEKSFQEMEWMLSHSSEDSIPVWFEYFFSKNGRFFIDSNTINPQTDKHLHRFLMQPKTHTQKYKFTKGSGSRPVKFSVVEGDGSIGKDITDNMYYAVAQAFGVPTDKVSTPTIRKHAAAIFSKLSTKEEVKKAKKAFVKDWKYPINKDLTLKVEHLGHALQAFDLLENMYASKGNVNVTSAISAEYDAVTSGFGLKNLQLPIIGDQTGNLRRVGVVRADDKHLNDPKVFHKSMNDLLDKTAGAVNDSYETLGAGVVFPKKASKSFDDMIKVAQSGDNVRTNVLTTYDYHKDVWAALIDVLPKAAADGTIDKALRNLFKPPFMTFNYSASIKSIRKDMLTGDLLTNLAKKMAAVDLSSTKGKTKEEKQEIGKLVHLMETIANNKISVEDLQKSIRTKHLYKIKIKKDGPSLDKTLSQMIDASYGQKVEDILTEKFTPFIEAQDTVNTAFRAMFEVFSIEFDSKLLEARKNGAVTATMERKIYEDLKDKWPMIKGPLSSMEDDGIGIYATETASPYGPYSGRKPVRANLAKPASKKLKGQDGVRVSHMVKQMVAAVAAGSVVPIHYIDGAVMARTILELASNKGTVIKGVAAIHDAIIPPLKHAGESLEGYNKSTLTVNTEYSFVHEIAKTLERFHGIVDSGSDVYKKTIIEVMVDGKPTKVSVKSFVGSTYADAIDLANRVNKARADLFSSLDQGAYIMHMAGTPDGVYEVKPGSIGFKPVETMELKQYTSRKKKTASGQTLSDLSNPSQNLC